MQEVEPGQGFRRADESALATRKIKGLPRRAMAGSPVGTPPPPDSSAPSAPEAPSVPKFSGFAGFGAASASSTPFSFSSSVPAKPAAPPPSSTDSAFTFGVSNSTGSPAFASTGPSISSSASSATKSFASSFSPSNTTSMQPEPPSNIFSGTKQVDETKDNELKEEIDYLVAIRGLNISLLSAISKAIESDPFVDVAEMLERYKSLRVSTKSGYDEKLKVVRGSGADLKSSAPFSSSGAVHTSQSTNATQSSAPSTSAFMPKPPSSFAGFSPLSTASSSKTTDTTETEGASTTKSPSFSFASSSTESTVPPAPPKSAFTFGLSGSTPSDASSTSSQPPFTFGSSNASSSTKTGTQSAFAFGNSNPPSSQSGSGSTSSTTTSPFGFSSTPSAFPGSIFGKHTGTDKDKEKDTIANVPSNGPSVGMDLFGGPSAFSTPEKTVSSGAFTFGSGSPGKAFGGFGKAGSIGNPVGFGFGSPPKTPDAETTTFANKQPGFSFGVPPQTAESSPAASTDAPVGGGSEEGTPVADSEAQPQLSSTSVHDQEGEGEEHETTTHEIRSKVYKMMKNGEGRSEWSDLGVGMLRLKKHKETNARRVLLRNSSTGKITINFNIYTGMNASVSKNTVSFIGHEEGVSTPYRIRTKTEEQANALKHALDREIEFVQAKSETS
ncbi:hypothetical protein AcW1_008939 [Taiwanofungus camphoratus]|nr:hypothetical protein AcV5_006968 [Antrodia cinnamomea]KAI0949275.1 hypothetical protein AcW1_008939 [Antrodia cinnamomea]KAI0958904.1 hypothetical protein AcV7_004588 [Antrodia cinnamomea]